MSKKDLARKKYEDFLNYIREKLKNNYDIVYREVYIERGKICVIYCKNISDIDFISKNIITPISQRKVVESIDIIKNEIIVAASTDYIHDRDKALHHILSGDVVLLFSFLEETIYCEAGKFSSRAIEEPPSEVVIKGPREGFTEDISENIALIRKRIRNVDFKLEQFTIGQENNIQVIMMYIENKTPESLVEDVRKQIEGIDAKFVMDINYIEERLKHKSTAFDTVGYTEKPDVLISKISEGRIGILANSSPFAITVPHFFIEEVAMADDYYLNKFPQNYFRLVRWTALFIALLLPSFYLALTTYHFGLIPSVFVFRLAVLRAGVPFPTVVEIMIMMFFFQLLREAGVRLPQAIGPAISIVGALILGDAAIRSGLASEITVLVIALSSISLFLLPKLYGAISIWSNIILLFSALLGLPGFFIGFILFCSHVASLTSCGYPYLYPLGTLNLFGFKDHIVRGDLQEISRNILERSEDS